MTLKGSRYIALAGKPRADGTMFVTSSNLPLFSAIVDADDWPAVIPHLKEFLEVNVGPVGDLEIVEDASDLFVDGPKRSDIPPAHVIAEIAARHVGAH